MPTQLNTLCQIPRLHLAWSTVKAKGSVGGIDGISLLEFEHDKRKEIPNSRYQEKGACEDRSNIIRYARQFLGGL